MAHSILWFHCISDCGKETNYMWVYILIGNMLRGIGETPITPLGISYIDDFAGHENTALYLGKILCCRYIIQQHTR